MDFSLRTGKESEASGGNPSGGCCGRRRENDVI